MPPLSDVLVRNAKPQSKPYKLPRDGGLFVLVNPDGAKWWRFAYVFEGREKSISFGLYPDVTVKLARQRRDEARRQLAEGTDPSAARQVAKARREFESANTFRTTAEEWLALKLDAMASGTHNKARWMLETFVYPELGSKPLSSITPPDVLAVIRSIEARGILETAHRTKARISEVFRYAIAIGRATSDPCRDLRGALKPKPATRHFAALTEPKDVAQLLRAIDGYTGTPEVHAALKLAPLLFVRPGELRAAQWPQFDLDGPSPTWRYFVSKTKANHIVPLCTQAVAVLRELHPLTGHGMPGKPDAPHHVFPNARTRSRPMSENAITAALRSLGYTGEQMTGHGFRATARTLLSELGWKPDAIERQLAHKASGPLGAAYDRAQYLDERRRMMQAWADYLDGLKRGSVVHGAFGRAA